MDPFDLTGFAQQYSGIIPLPISYRGTAGDPTTLALTVTRTLTAADVVAMRTTPITLVPAVANKIIVPIAVAVRSSKPNDGKTWVVDQDMVIYYANDVGATIATKTDIFPSIPVIAGGSAAARSLLSRSANISGTVADTTIGNPVGAAILMANQTTTAQDAGATLSASIKLLYVLLDPNP